MEVDGNGTDDYGFSALSGGWRGGDGSVAGVGEYGAWWTYTETGNGGVYAKVMGSDGTKVGEVNFGKVMGVSVRCVAD